MDSRTVWTVVSINASRGRRNCLDFEEFLRTREKSLKTTVHYCPTVHGTPQTSMSFPPQSNVIYDPK